MKWGELVEIIKHGLLTHINNLYNELFSVHSQLSLTSLGSALTIAAVFLVLQRRRKNRTIRPRTLWRGLFPRYVVRNPSTTADFGYLLFNTFIYGSLLGWAAVSYQFLTNAVISGMVFTFGAPTPSALPEFASRSIVTAMVFLAYEFGYWLDHYLKHRVPALWELHKVHHAAEVLTPMTSFRVHPLDTWIFANILAITAALSNGVTSYMFGDTTYQYAISGGNIILIAFIHIYIHLQHSQIWISFRGALGRIFMSPAHHQIHHSDNPVHFNKNLGSTLAIWDWLFGTLYVPAKEREKIIFGVGEGYSNAHTITGSLISPIGHAAAALLALIPKRVRWAPATDVERG